ncbi:MAG TPA: putative sulfate exporter family transporter, partial [bacterium]|nr:putative sulfate exporter family transporter [bacterium]
MGEVERGSVIPGLLLCGAVATSGFLLADIPLIRDHLHFGALLLVILLGMLLRTVIRLPERAIPGIRCAQRPILRAAVAGLGFRLSFDELVHIGGSALIVVILSTVLALFSGWWLARRFGVPEKLGLLLGVGGAICGASAIVAADSVVRGEKRDVATSLAIITLLGTIGIFLYPLLRAVTGMNDFVFGVWDGASLHEMAQVVAAGFAVNEEAARVATVVKLARIALLAPTVMALAWWARRHDRSAGEAHVAAIPWFLVLFVAFAIVNSLSVIPPNVLDLVRRIDLWLLCVGMAGVGLQTGFHDVREAGAGAIAAGAL